MQAPPDGSEEGSISELDTGAEDCSACGSSTLTEVSGSSESALSAGTVSGTETVKKSPEFRSLSLASRESPL